MEMDFYYEEVIPSCGIPCGIPCDETLLLLPLLKWTRENIYVEGVYCVKGQPYFFIDSEHPIIMMLRLYKEIPQSILIHGDNNKESYYKINKDFFNECCQILLLHTSS